MKKVEIEFERADGAQKRLPTRAEMRSWMKSACASSAQFCVRFVDETEGRMLNKTYRGKNRPTNVLTFDYCHGPVAQADIVICTAVLERESREQHKSFRSHLAHLLIHATLHAQGYDHATDDEAEQMEALETKLMKKLGFENPYYDKAIAH